MALYIQGPDVGAVYANLRDREVDVTPPHVTAYGMREVSARDPDGFTRNFLSPADAAADGARPPRGDGDGSPAATSRGIAVDGVRRADSDTLAGILAAPRGPAPARVTPRLHSTRSTTAYSDREEGGMKRTIAASPQPAPADLGSCDPEAALRAFVAKFDGPRQRLIAELRAALRRRYPAAHELVWDNYNFFVIGYSPTARPSDAPLSIAAASGGVSLCFVRGATLPDPTGLLSGAGKQTRFLRVADAADLDRPAVEALLAVAVAGAAGAMRDGPPGPLVVRSVSAKQRPRRVPPSPRPDLS